MSSSIIRIATAAAGLAMTLGSTSGTAAQRGVHGQTIYVDPVAEMVLVRFASFPKPQNPLIDPTSLPAFQAVATYLKSK